MFVTHLRKYQTICEISHSIRGNENQRHFHNQILITNSRRLFDNCVIILGLYIIIGRWIVLGRESSTRFKYESQLRASHFQYIDLNRGSFFQSLWLPTDQKFEKFGQSRCNDVPIFCITFIIIIFMIITFMIIFMIINFMIIFMIIIFMIIFEDDILEFKSVAESRRGGALMILPSRS